MLTVVLLLISNVFMTFAWYGHLKHKSAPLLITILASWGIAFFEYCFQVPANRWGSSSFTTAQLKVIQEVITLAVFTAFSVLYLREEFKWNYAAGFACILLAVFFVFHDFAGRAPSSPSKESARDENRPASAAERKAA